MAEPHVPTIAVVGIVAGEKIHEGINGNVVDVALTARHDLEPSSIGAHAHDAAASIYTEFSARHAEGLQHVGVMTASLDEHLERLRSQGIEPVQWGATANGMRFAYVDTDAHPGAMIELIETGPAVEAFFAMVRKAAENWDGTRPLRRLS